MTACDRVRTRAAPAQADLSGDANFDEDLFGNIIMGILLTPVFLCLFMVMFELTGPLYEEWRAEQERREKAAQPTVGFCQYLVDMVSHDAEEAEALAAAMETSLSEETGALIAKAREGMEGFEKYTMKTNFLLKQARRLMSAVPCLCPCPPCHHAMPRYAQWGEQRRLASPPQGVVSASGSGCWCSLLLPSRPPPPRLTPAPSLLLRRCGTPSGRCC